jgi:hypothetical protein
MNDFSEVMKNIIEMLERDCAEGIYTDFSTYWKQHRGYWELVFSEDAFYAINNKLSYWSEK